MRRALILAAGRGERMRPLTDTTPKPLLPVHGKPLIVWQLERLATANIRYVVINTSYLAEQFPATLGDGSRWGLRIRYSFEGPHPLETGGGLLRALPLIGGDEPFIAVSGDLYTDYDFAQLPCEPTGLAHLVLVPNPDWHAQGDFNLQADGRITPEPGQRLTFGNIGVYRPELFSAGQRATAIPLPVHSGPTAFKLAPLLRQACAQGLLDGEAFHGFWRNLGTPDQRNALETELATNPGHPYPP